MQTLALSFRYLWSRPLAALLNLLLLSLGLASITFVLLASEQIDRAFERDLAGIDLVVGAKGSPLQLILAGVFHLDNATGNIPLDEVQRLQKNPLVAKLVPLSLGDSYRGYRIVGTTADYVTHYRAQTAEGRLWGRPLEAVLGAEVAQTAAMKAGDRFQGNHGLSGGGHAHGNAEYQVAGVLAPCACVLDRLILTSLESVWAVHEPMPLPAPASAPMAAPAQAAVPVPAAPAGRAGEPEHASHEHEQVRAARPAAPAVAEPKREVTLALVSYRSPLAAASLPRLVNSTTSMQAAAPALEISRLLRMVGVGTELLRGLAGVLLVTAALSVFIALWTAVRERSADLAMLRMLGASRTRIAGLLLCESLWLAALASVLGLAAGHLLAGLAGGMLQARQSLPLSGAHWVAQELWVPAAAVTTAVAAAMIPVLGAWRTDVAALLNAR